MSADAGPESTDEARRKAARSRVFLTVKACGPLGEIDARVLDLSERGARLNWVGAAPAVGSELNLTRGDLTVSGRVAWAADGKCGVEFHAPIDDRELLGRAARPSAASSPAFAISPVRHTTPSEERRLARTPSVTVGLTVPER